VPHGWAQDEKRVGFACWPRGSAEGAIASPCWKKSYGPAYDWEENDSGMLRQGTMVLGREAVLPSGPSDSGRIVGKRTVRTDHPTRLGAGSSDLVGPFAWDSMKDGIQSPECGRHWTGPAGATRVRSNGDLLPRDSASVPPKQILEPLMCGRQPRRAPVRSGVPNPCPEGSWSGSSISSARSAFPSSELCCPAGSWVGPDSSGGRRRHWPGLGPGQCLPHSRD
jgi:hypothetical protein